MKPQASSSSIGLRQAHAASSANLIVPRRKFADHSGYLFRIRTFPKTRFEIARSEAVSGNHQTNPSSSGSSQLCWTLGNVLEQKWSLVRR